MPRLVGDLGNGFCVFGVPQDEAVFHGMGAQPAEGLGVFKALGQIGVLRAVQVGSKAAVVLRVARRVHDICRLLFRFGFAQALIAEILGLLVVEVLLVVHAAVAALHPDGHAVLCGGGLHGEERIGGFGLQGLVHSGGRAARLGGKGMIVRHFVRVVHQHHAGIIQNGLRLPGGQQTAFCL